MPDFNSLPTDNSSTTNLKYDIIASKFMNGIRNHQRQHAPVSSSSVDAAFYVIGTVLQLALAILIFVFIGLRWIWKRL